MNPTLTLTLVALSLAVAFLLSGMEVGVFALSRFRIRRLARQGDRRAARLQAYLDHPESFLWTILVGNTLATFVAITVVALHFRSWLGVRPTLFMLGMLGVLLVLWVLADLLPKLLFRRFPNRLCVLGVVPFGLLRVLLSPAVAITEWVSSRVLRLTGGRAFTGRMFASRAELRQAIEESAQSLSREEVVMINRILDLQNRRVRDVMTPIERAATLPAGGTVSDLLDLVRNRPVSYVPLWRSTESRRRILGVAAVSTVLYDASVDASRPLESIVQPALFLRENTRLETALRILQRGRQRMAVVLDADRREVGVVTLNDILRAMFGEVRV